jgi:hypothetical protein
MHLLGPEGLLQTLDVEGHDRPGCIKMKKLTVYASVACNCIWVNIKSQTLMENVNHWSRELKGEELG